MISGYTEVCGVIGDPVRHSLSPAIHNAAFADMGVDWVSLAFTVAPEDATVAVAGLRAMGLRGVSVTMPHKALVVPALDQLAPSAQALGVVNCIANDNGVLTGHSTDGIGFVNSLASDFGVPVAGGRFVIVGAGGAARSIVHALGVDGAQDIAVTNRTLAKAEDVVLLGGAAARVVDGASLTAAMKAADVVVNTTSVGMGEDPSMPFDPSPLTDAQVLVDIIYNPIETALMTAAAAAGARTANGVSMLVHQAVEQLRLWTGHMPDPAVMMTAASAALAGR